MPLPIVTVLGLGEIDLGGVGLGEAGFVIEEEAPTNQGQRYPDPFLGDYAQQDGIISKTTSTRQKIIILLSTKLGSSLAVRGFEEPEYHDETTEQITKSEVEEALEVLTSSNVIRLDNVTVRTSANNVPGRLGIKIDYFDVEKNEKPEPINL